MLLLKKTITSEAQNKEGGNNSMHLHSLQLQNTVEMQKHFQQSIFLQCRATWTELTYIKNITLTAGDTKASKSTN